MFLHQECKGVVGMWEAEGTDWLVACPLEWRLEVVSYSQLQAHIRFVHYLLDFDFHLRAGIADCFIRFEAVILRRRRRVVLW